MNPDNVISSIPGLQDLGDFQIENAKSRAAYKLGTVKKVHVTCPKGEQTYYVSDKAFTKMAGHLFPDSSQKSYLKSKRMEITLDRKSQLSISLVKQNNPISFRRGHISSFGSSELQLQRKRKTMRQSTFFASTSQTDEAKLERLDLQVEKVLGGGVEGKSVGGVFDLIKLSQKARGMQSSLNERGDPALASQAGMLAQKLEEHLCISQEVGARVVELGREELKALHKMGVSQAPKIASARKEGAHFDRRSAEIAFPLTVKGNGDVFIHFKAHKLGQGAEKKAFDVLGFDAKGQCIGKHVDLSVYSINSPDKPQLYASIQAEDQSAKQCRGHEFEQHVVDPFIAKAGYFGRRSVPGSDGAKMSEKVIKNRVIAKVYSLDVAQASFSNDKKLSPQQRAYAMVGGAKGITAMHERGLLHRDVKPANIFIDSNGEGVLGDLGEAVDFENVQIQSGSELYRGPEGMDAECPIDTKAGDIWAFGTSLWQTLYAENHTKTLLTIPELRQGLTDEEIQEKLASMPEPESVEESRAQEVIRACLKVDPVQRPTAREVVGILEGTPLSLTERYTGRSQMLGEVQSAMCAQGIPKLLVSSDVEGRSYSLPVHRNLDHSSKVGDFAQKAKNNLLVLDHLQSEGREAFLAQTENIVKSMRSMTDHHIDRSLDEACRELEVGQTSDTRDEKLLLIKEKLEVSPNPVISAMVQEVEMLIEGLDTAPQEMLIATLEQLKANTQAALES